MRKAILIQIFIIITALQICHAQEFDSNQQYNQAMANAKQAFEANQFSEAVMFYREALKIKPDARLPKYKIEDIRTIYLEKELDAIKPKSEVTENQKLKENKAKEIEAENVLVAEVAKVEATRKMNEDADKAEAELRQVPVNVIEINEEIDSRDLNKAVEINEIAGDKEVLVKNIEPKTQTKIEGTTTKDMNPTMELTKREVPIIAEEIKETEPVVEPKPIVKTVPQAVKPKPENPVEKQKWVEQEKKRLLETYPNKKTVEEIDKPGKHITRVIMNIDNNVTVYLKVHHSWGATFFFIDEVGLDLRSINEQYFNLMTNLKTYGG